MAAPDAPIDSIECELCGLFFPSTNALSKHRSKFCIGSNVHTTVLKKQQEAAQELDPAAISVFLAGGRAPNGDNSVSALSVGELRDRMVLDAARAEKQRQETAASAERAAVQLASQRAKAEVQQRNIDAQLREQRKRELEVRVQRRAAERLLRDAELQSQAVAQQHTLEELQQHEDSVAAERRQAQHAVERTRREITGLHSGIEAAGEQLIEARAVLRAATGPPLSDAAAERRAVLIHEQAVQTRAAQLEGHRLRARQQLLEEQAVALEGALSVDNKGSPVILGEVGPDDRTAVLLRQQQEDELRIALLRSQISEAKHERPTFGPGPVGAPPACVESTLSAKSPRGPSAPASRSDARSRRCVRMADDVPSGPLVQGTHNGPKGEAPQIHGNDGPPTIAMELAQLQKEYSERGGGNAQLLQLMAKLQQDARDAYSEAEKHTACSPFVERGVQRGVAQDPPLPRRPAGQSAVPDLPCASPTHATERREISQSPPMPLPAEVRQHMAAMQRAIDQREEEARQLQALLGNLQAQRRAGDESDALSTFAMQMKQQASDTTPVSLAQLAPPSTRDAELIADELELRQMQAKHERALAKVRFEREMLEESTRLRVLKEEAARKEIELRQQQEHKEWIEEQKRQLVESRVQREVLRHGTLQLAPSSLPSTVLPNAPYTPESGFVVFWDFACGLPRHVSQCHLVYALYDGARLISTVKSLPVADCEPESGGLARAIFALRRQFLHLEPSPSLQLFAEAQRVVAPATEPGGAPKTASLGWTSLPIFLPSRQLNAGFWKLALCRPPIQVSLPTAQRQTLPPMALFVRLVLTADMERNRFFAVDPDQTAAAYQALHRAESLSAHGPMADSPHARRAAEGAEGAEGAAERPRTQASRASLGSSGGGSAARPPSGDRPGSGVSACGPVPASMGGFAPVELPRAAGALSSFGRASTAADELEVLSPPEQFDPGLGVEVRLQRLREWRPADPLAFIRALRESGCSPLRVHLSAVLRGQRQAGGLMSPAGQFEPGGEWQVDWDDGVTMKVPAGAASHETILLAELVDTSKARSLGFATQLHADEPASTESRLSAPTPSSVLAWGVLPLFSNGAEPSTTDGFGAQTNVLADELLIKSGRHRVLLRSPPVLLSAQLSTDPPPADYQRGELTLQLQRGPPPEVKEQQEEARADARQQADRLAQPAIDNLGVPESAWLRSAEPDRPPRDEPSYSPTDGGANLLLEGARWLPDSLVACKATLALYDAQGGVVSETSGMCSVQSSDVRSPEFRLRLELRGTLPADGTLVVSLVALQRDVAEPRQLGYAALALFHKRGEHPPKQPSGAHEAERVLNLGAFQLPVMLGFAEEVAQARGGRFSEGALLKTARLPCASVLLRLCATSIDPGPPPAYSSRAYNSSRCLPAPHEVVLYRQRLQRPPRPAFEAISREARERGQQIASLDEAARWLRVQLAAPAQRRFDLRGFASYNPTAGLQLGVLRAYNLPQSALSFALVSTAPPAALYRSPPQPAVGVRMTEAHDWDSPIRSPIWTSAAAHLPQVAFERGSLLVVDIRCLTHLQQPASLKSQGWSVLPVFAGEGVNSGIFQLPLYAGTPTRELLQQMSQRGWEDVLRQAVSSKRVKLVESASVVVSLLDAQRFGEWDRAELRPEPADRSLLPSKRIKHYLKVVNSKPLSTLMSSADGTTRDEVQALANRMFRTAIGLTEDANDSAAT